MTEPVDVLFRTFIMPESATSPGSYGGVYVGTFSKVNFPNFYSKIEDNLIWVLVLDRKNLKNPPVFNATLPNNTDVPAGLTDLLTPEHLLFVSVSANILQVPQGGLYKTLMENGAGGELQKLEKLSTGFACGVSGAMYYMLASVPGSGVPGIEIGDVTGHAIPLEPGFWSITVPAANIFMSMVPGPHGYTPVKIGS